MINFLSVKENRIQLFNDKDEMVCESASFVALADAILSNDNLAPVVYRSSEWMESPFCEYFDDLWYRVCKLV